MSRTLVVQMCFMNRYLSNISNIYSAIIFCEITTAALSLCVSILCLLTVKEIKNIVFINYVEIYFFLHSWIGLSCTFCSL